MLGRHLKFLAEVADLARLDFEAAGITLLTKNDKLYARYRGAYSTGQRWLTSADIGGEELPELNLAVSAVQFKSLVGLLNEELPVKLTPRNNTLRMESGGSRIDLAVRSDMEDLENEEKVPGDEIINSTVDLLQREFEVASEFSARSMSKPVLTGLRVSSDGSGTVSCEACDGYCLYLSEFMVDKTEPFEVILPAYDIVLGLKLLKSGSLKAFSSSQGGHLYLLGDRAMFRSHNLRGEWPATERIRAEVERQEPVAIPTSLIRALVQSVRILGSSNDLVLKGDGENLFLQTTASEYGAFQAAIPATLDGTYIYDVSYYLLALNLGSQLMLSVPVDPAGKYATYIEADHRRFWIGQRMYQPKEKLPMEGSAVVMQQD
jgi:hypothetical protein